MFISKSQNLSKTIFAVLVDIFAIAFIYFIPTISHLLNFPLYLIEPMRIMVIIAMVHTNRQNALILAITLPFVSYIFSAHPSIAKTGLIATELAINVLIFYVLAKKIPSILAIFSSIWISKGIYYGLKFLVILMFFPTWELISTPIYIQVITSAILSLYFFLFLYIKTKNQ
jgi:hypothetical protein